MSEAETRRRFSKELYTTLSRVKRPAYLKAGANNNLGQFSLNFLSEIIQEVERYRNDVRESGGRAREPRLALIMSSMPASGKTYYGEMLDRFIAGYLKERFPGQDPSLLYRVVTWEEHGKRAAFEAGEIQTPLNQPATAAETFIATRYLADNIAGSVDGTFVSRIEAPASTAYLDNYRRQDYPGGWVGRVQGNKAIRDLLYGRNQFEKLAERYSLKVHMAGLVPGPWLGLMPDYRGAIKASRNLREAGSISTMFGKNPPGSRADLQRVQRDGATPEQIIQMEGEIYRIMGALASEGKITLPDIDLFLSFRADYENSVQKVTGLKRGRLASLNYVTGVLIEYLQMVDYGMSDRYTFIGVNNPTPRELGLALHRLQRFYLRQRYKAVSDEDIRFKRGANIFE